MAACVHQRGECMLRGFMKWGRVHQVCTSEGDISRSAVSNWHLKSYGKLVFFKNMSFTTKGLQRFPDEYIFFGWTWWELFGRWELFDPMGIIIFFAGGQDGDYLAGGNLRMSIHSGDTIGEGLAARISPLQWYKDKISPQSRNCWLS